MADVEIIKYDFAKKGAEEATRECMIQTAIKIHNAATNMCPVKHGQLRNSIMWRVEEKEDGFNKSGKDPAPGDQMLTSKPGELEGYVGTNSDHWYPEFGTRNQAAQPFLRPAVEVVMGAKAEEIARKYGNAAMEKASGSGKKKVIKS